MEDCNYCLVDEKVRERRIGSMREREREVVREMGFEDWVCVREAVRERK